LGIPHGSVPELCLRKTKETEQKIAALSSFTDTLHTAVIVWDSGFLEESVIIVNDSK